MNGFFIGECLGLGWRAFKKNLLFFIGLLVILFLVNFLPGYLAQTYFSNNAIVSGAISVLGWIFGLILGVGLVRVQLQVSSGRSGDFSDLVPKLSQVVLYFVTAVVVGVIVVVGLILFVVPGIILLIRLQFWPYLVVEKGLNPIEAIRESWAISRGVGWDLVGLGAVLVLVNVLGVLLVLVGLVVTIPVTMMTTAFAYRKLLTSNA